MTAAVAIAAAEAVEREAGIRPALKWPNDLVVDDLKLAGVLAELLPGPGTMAVVVGLGLNLDWPPERLLPTATALNVVAGRAPGRDEVLTAMLERVGQWYGNLDAVAGEYRRCCVTIGRVVRVDLSAESFTGRALDIDDEGHLLVDVGPCVRTVAAGDVIHIRRT